MLIDKWLSCGRYACRIIANRNVFSTFSDQWKTKIQDIKPVSETVTIRVEEASFMHTENIMDGWIAEGKHAIYYLNGEMLFTLELESSNEVKVLLGTPSAINARLGIHYGLMLALHKECVGLHGVTLLCGNEIIILSAPSGTGKTTLAMLLERYCDAIIINGDFALLSPTDEGIIFEPTPFCGTSGRALNHRFRVDRVVFLSQSRNNRWQELTGREAMTRFMSNCFTPTWDRNLQKDVQENVLKCITAMKVSAYAFAPTQEAAEEFLKRIEDKDSSFYSEKHE